MDHEKHSELSAQNEAQIEQYNRLVAEGYSHIRISPWGTLQFDKMYVLPSLRISAERAARGPSEASGGTEQSDLSEKVNELSRLLCEAWTEDALIQKQDEPAAVVNMPFQMDDAAFEAAGRAVFLSDLSTPDRVNSDINRRLDDLLKGLGGGLSFGYQQTARKLISEIRWQLILNGYVSGLRLKELAYYECQAHKLDLLVPGIEKYLQKERLSDISGVLKEQAKDAFEALASEMEALAARICQDQKEPGGSPKTLKTRFPPGGGIWYDNDPYSSWCSAGDMLDSYFDLLQEDTVFGSERVVVTCDASALIRPSGEPRPVLDLLMKSLRFSSLCGAKTMTEEMFLEHLERGECLLIFYISPVNEKALEVLCSFMKSAFSGNVLLLKSKSSFANPGYDCVKRIVDQNGCSVEMFPRRESAMDSVAGYSMIDWAYNWAIGGSNSFLQFLGQTKKKQNRSYGLLESDYYRALSTGIIKMDHLTSEQRVRFCESLSQAKSLIDHVETQGDAQTAAEEKNKLAAIWEELEELFRNKPGESLMDTDEVRIQQAAALFENDEIIYVIGGAGYGKSLFLRRICTKPELLDGFADQPRLVIRGDIKRLIRDDGTRRTMMDFLKECFEEQSLHGSVHFSEYFLEECLKAGRCLVLLDALDEVGNDHRDSVHDLILSFFTRTYPGNRVCITSRDRGFIPRRNITCFYIQPVNERDVVGYADRLIALGRFPEDYREGFITEAAKLVRKDFVKGFLTLSLLLNIYQSEGKLPDTKLQLYQKCFEYIANVREKDKDLIRNTRTGKNYDWEILEIFLTDQAFMQLANCAVPNNRDVSERNIKKVMSEHFGGEFANKVACRNAVDEFLQYCGDRTEVFVPSVNSNTHYRFFHRSFFEYFFAQYIMDTADNSAAICDLLDSFDADSEIYELLVMLYKENGCGDRLEDLNKRLFQRAGQWGQDAGDSERKAFEMLVMLLPHLNDPELDRQFTKLILSVGQAMNGCTLAVSMQMIFSTMDQDHYCSWFRENQKKALRNMMKNLSRCYLKNQNSCDNFLRDLKNSADQRVTREELLIQKRYFDPLLMLMLPDHTELFDKAFKMAASRNYLIGPLELKHHEVNRVYEYIESVNGLPPEDRNRVYYDLLMKGCGQEQNGYG